MEEKKTDLKRWIIPILVACLCASAAFFAGKKAGQTEAQNELEILYELNRAEFSGESVL